MLDLILLWCSLEQQRNDHHCIRKSQLRCQNTNVSQESQGVTVLHNSHHVNQTQSTQKSHYSRGRLRVGFSLTRRYSQQSTEDIWIVRTLKRGAKTQNSRWAPLSSNRDTMNKVSTATYSRTPAWKICCTCKWQTFYRN